MKFIETTTEINDYDDDEEEWLDQLALEHVGVKANTILLTAVLFIIIVVSSCLCCTTITRDCRKAEKPTKPKIKRTVPLRRPSDSVTKAVEPFLKGSESPRW